MINFGYLYNVESYQNILGMEHKVDRNLSWNILENATLLPFAYIPDNLGGGIIDERGEYIDGSGLHKGLGTGYDISGMKIHKDEGEVVFLGLWACIWGHDITDNIRRLWVLYNDEFMEKYGHHRFVYISVDNRDPEPGFAELLRVLGIERVSLEKIDVVTMYRKIILPDECIWNQDDIEYFTREYVYMIDKVRAYGEAHFRPGGNSKVYYSHRKYCGWRGLGERKIERFFEKLGYSIVFPEEHTFNEQLNILLNCTEFASTCGSASHNCVFLRDHTKVYIIPRAFHIPKYQLALDQVHELDITYVDSTLSMYVHPDHPWIGPFYYIVSKNLQKCFRLSVEYSERATVFKIYRLLAFAINKTAKPEEYYNTVREEYLPGFPFDKKLKYSVFLKTCSRLKIQKILAYLLKWLESRDCM
ncbi:MAG: glycosyltransferase family 61 protein [Clostridiales bacterium]|nr:glycosyltransferase family 61 protein [Clostridiales bacterium]